MNLKIPTHRDFLLRVTHWLLIVTYRTRLEVTRTAWESLREWVESSTCNEFLQGDAPSLYATASGDVQSENVGANTKNEISDDQMQQGWADRLAQPFPSFRAPTSLIRTTILSSFIPDHRSVHACCMWQLFAALTAFPFHLGRLDSDHTNSFNIAPWVGASESFASQPTTGSVPNHDRPDLSLFHYVADFDGMSSRVECHVAERDWEGNNLVEPRAPGNLPHARTLCDVTSNQSVIAECPRDSHGVAAPAMTNGVRAVPAIPSILNSQP